MHRMLKISSVCWLLLFSCQVFANAKSPSITFINPGADKGFWGDVSAVMLEASSQLNIELEVLYSDRNRLRMLHHARSVVARHDTPDAVIIVNELQQGSQLLKIIGTAGIPIYFLLNTLTETQIAEASNAPDITPIVIGSIVPENFRAGFEMLVDLVNEIRRDKPEGVIDVLAILGDQLTPAALDREAGMRKAIDQLENVELKRAFSVLWDPEIAARRVATAMSLIEFDVIWAANDALAIASRNSVMKNCKETSCLDVPIAGLNWSREGISAVRNGVLITTHGGHFTAGGYAIAALHRYLNGQRIAKNVTLRMDSIKRDNVERFDRIISGSRWDTFNFRALAESIDESSDVFDPVILFDN